MKVYLIKASADGPFKEYKKATGAPPQNIFSAAAATPEGVKIDMCDETIGMKPNMRTDADVVALFFHTPDANHAYKLAKKFRDNGKIVVFGGLHASLLTDDAVAHADAVMVGEVEGIWGKLLRDVVKGELKPRYERKNPVDMAKLKPYPTDIIPPSKYQNVWSVLVSRGCVHRCEYCVIPPFFKGKYRRRPIENVVEEIKAVPVDWFELHADNLTADREYAIELFKALKPLNINWYGESTIKMADDEELLRLAAESGCRTLLIGIETPSQAALDDTGKAFVKPEDIKEKIDRFHEHGIMVTSSMIFGFDTHTKDIFKESADFCREIGIDSADAVLLAPFAGTPLYHRLKDEGRLLTDDWAKYDCANAVFEPKHMTPKELEAGAYGFYQEFKDMSMTSYKTANKTYNAGKSRGSQKRANSESKQGSLAGDKPVFSNIKWQSLLALVIIGLSIYFNQYWLWGVILVWWVVKDLARGQTYLMEFIDRSENPIMYWVIILLWTFGALYALSWAPIFMPLWNKYFMVS